MIRQFSVNFTEKEISLIYQKVKDYPWDSVKDLDGWEHGTNKKYLKELCDYWITKFDWSKHELEINKFKNFTTDIEGIKIHFINYYWRLTPNSFNYLYLLEYSSCKVSYPVNVVSHLLNCSS